MAELKYLQEFKSVRIVLPVVSAPPLSLECVARAENPPFIDAHFLPGQLPSDRLDLDGECQISFFGQGEQTHVLKVKIDKVVSGERLRLEAFQTATRAQQREFFRIDVDLTLKYRRVSEGEEALPRRVQGRVNLSGGGMWFPVKDALDVRECLSMEIHLPGSPPACAFAAAEVIRMTGSDEASRGVAVKFTDIESEDRDEIIAYCFAEQRRQLRTRVRLTD